MVGPAVEERHVQSVRRPQEAAGAPTRRPPPRRVGRTRLVRLCRASVARAMILLTRVTGNYGWSILLLTGGGPLGVLSDQQAAGRRDEGDAAHPAGDQAAPGEVQGRPRTPQSRADGRLSPPQGESARGLLADVGAAARVPRPLQRANAVDRAQARALSRMGHGPLVSGSPRKHEASVRGSRREFRS